MEVFVLPNSPKKPCKHQNCPNLTHGRFCETHAKQESKRYEKYDRDPESRKRYGAAWRRIRKRYISAHLLCERCKLEGKLNPAEQVHHIKLLSEGGTHDTGNLISLCAHHHSQLHAEQGDRWGWELRLMIKMSSLREFHFLLCLNIGV